MHERKRSFSTPDTDSSLFSMGAQSLPVSLSPSRYRLLPVPLSDAWAEEAFCLPGDKAAIRVFAPSSVAFVT